MVWPTSIMLSKAEETLSCTVHGVAACVLTHLSVLYFVPHFSLRAKTEVYDWWSGCRTTWMWGETIRRTNRTTVRSLRQCSWFPWQPVFTGMAGNITFSSNGVKWIILSIHLCTHSSFSGLCDFYRSQTGGMRTTEGGGGWGGGGRGWGYDHSRCIYLGSAEEVNCFSVLWCETCWTNVKKMSLSVTYWFFTAVAKSWWPPHPRHPPYTSAAATHMNGVMSTHVHLMRCEDKLQPDLRSLHVFAKYFSLV